MRGFRGFRRVKGNTNLFRNLVLDPTPPNEPLNSSRIQVTKKLLLKKSFTWPENRVHAK